MTGRERTAARFWRDAGGPGDFPRDIVAAAGWALPVSVVALPNLTAAAVAAWLRTREISVPSLPARPLRACLIAREGRGVILLDSLDPPDERRYSVAHEVGHYLRDHRAIRTRVRRRLGAAAVAVLDGRRPASVGERVDALLAGLPLRPLTHLLNRDRQGRAATPAVAAAESAADALALELLAPRADAEQRLVSLPAGECPAARIAADFGLPPRIAHAYARQLRLDAMAARSVRERWGLTVGESPSEKNLQNPCRTSYPAPEQGTGGG